MNEVDIEVDIEKQRKLLMKDNWAKVLSTWNINFVSLSVNAPWSAEYFQHFMF